MKQTIFQSLSRFGSWGFIIVLLSPGCHSPSLSVGELFRLQGHQDSVTHLLFLPEGNKLASIDLKNELILWDLKTRSAVKKTVVPGEYGKLALAPTFNSLVVANWPKTAFMLDSKTLAIRSRFVTLNDPSCIRVSPDGESFAYCAIGSELVNIVNTETKKTIVTLDHKSKCYYAVAWLPDGKRLVTITWGQIHVWDVFSEKKIETFKVGDHMIHSVVMAGDDAIAVSSTDGIFMWHFKNKIRKRISADVARRLAVSANHKMLASSNCDTPHAAGNLTIREIPSGKLLCKFQPHLGEIQAFEFSPDGSKIATAGLRDNLIKVWQISNLKNR